jgi:hypothetical protein
VEKAGKNYKRILILFFIFTILMGAVVVLAFFLPLHNDYQSLIAIALLLALLVGMGAFRPRLMYYKEELMFERLKLNSTGKISVRQSPLSEIFLRKLLAKEFQINHRDDKLTILTKYIKDRSQYHLKRPMLMVFVAIHDPKIDFQSELIIKYINIIEDGLYKEKKKIFHYTVYVAKEGPTMSKQDREECDNVSFSRIGKRSIVTINLFYETKNNACYFLHSDKYWPTSYYNYAVNYLKELL